MEKEEKVAEDITEGTDNGEVIEEEKPDAGDGPEVGPDAELAQAREEAREAQEKLLRMAADFDNQKKRLQRDKDTALKYAEENLIKEILPAIDNLERALGQDQNSKDFGKHLLEGVELTLKGLLATLEKSGLKALVSVGEPFDPNFHEALVMEASKEVPEQRVIQEYEKGYMLKERLIRAAKVVVSKGDVEE